ncbi:MAG: hypothetical protein WDN00_05120 [Limisphaerales bacterium]
MVVDIIFPGWMPWRQFALAQDIPEYFLQVEEINHLKWDTLVSGSRHENRDARGCRASARIHE